MLVQDVNDPDTFFVLSFWDSIEDVAAWEGSADFQERFASAIRPFTVGTTTVSLCQIVSAAGLDASILEGVTHD
ncbi:antibiotic biosynthesis monooxygenase [Tianweitania sediminis]|uniref:Antibiotic biosynthesis monooxygenase n=2 Tax=Tianweitania sediminis TaxID=1502156 RepID=A0A8J7R499_9HYPH|nr:antibiotic biosynthesis monooxygenase [Tianweitania sediminis]